MEDKICFKFMSDPPTPNQMITMIYDYDNQEGMIRAVKTEQFIRTKIIILLRKECEPTNREFGEFMMNKIKSN